MILLTTLYFAMSLPANAPLQWWGPLSIEECRKVERSSYGTWCQRIDSRKAKRR